MLPLPIRRRDDTSPSSSRFSTSAATGAIRTARRAGPSAEIRVTPTPTAIATRTVRASNTSGAGGSVTPNALSTAFRPTAASTPSPRPTIEAAIPTSAASPSTDRNTCRRLAPTIRSSASSRVRWPTVIENVLKIVNAPTNREINANTSSAVERKESASLTALESSLATVWPLTTCTPGGSTLAIARCSRTLSTPGLASTLIVSKYPRELNRSCAVGRSKPARVAPARLSSLPKVTIPEIVNVSGEESSSTRTWLPTRKWYFVAVALSITTASGVEGARPATSPMDDSCRSGSNENPSADAAFPTAFPLATNCA